MPDADNHNDDIDLDDDAVQTEDPGSEILDIEDADDADQGNEDSNDDDTEEGDGTEGEVPTNAGD
jgi:hypothetical protein